MFYSLLLANDLYRESHARVRDGAYTWMTPREQWRAGVLSEATIEYLLDYHDGLVNKRYIPTRRYGDDSSEKAD